MKLVIDTNLWVSALLSKKTRDQLFKIIRNEEYEILTHPQLLNELEEVLKRPKIQKYVRQELVTDLLSLLQFRLNFVEFHSVLKVCRDEEDNYLLALALDNQADFLLTGDKDLLVLHPFREISIVSLTDFVENHFSST